MQMWKLWLFPALKYYYNELNIFKNWNCDLFLCFLSCVLETKWWIEKMTSRLFSSLIDLMIVFLINPFVIWSIKFQKMEKKSWSQFPKAQGDVLQCLLLSQIKDIQFTIIEDKRNQKIFTTETLESKNCGIFQKD